MGSFLAPILAGRLLDLGPIADVATWYPVFGLGAGCVIMACLMYHCARYHLQPWAVGDEKLNDVSPQEYGLK